MICLLLTLTELVEASRNRSATVLIKVNRIGTVSETIAAITLARQHHYQIFISHRSGGRLTPLLPTAVAVNANLSKLDHVAFGTGGKI